MYRLIYLSTLASLYIYAIARQYYTLIPPNIKRIK